MPKITVCVPTYNRSGLLRGCLESLGVQTLRDIEILVSDNCSADDTEVVVRSIPDRRIQYFRTETNIGPVPNINTLLRRATGDHVVVAHDDDVYLPEFLERESALLDRCPKVAMVHCAAVMMAVDGSLTRLVRAYPDTGCRPGPAEFDRFLEGHNVVCSTVMVRRSAYDAVGLFESRYLCNDFQMWLRLARHGDIGYVAEPLVHVRVHADTVTNWLTPQRWHDEFVAIVNEQMEEAAAARPEIAGRRREYRRRAALAQGRRFFMAAVSEIAKGRFSQAGGYADVLKRFERDGLPRTYFLLASLLNNRPGRQLLKAVRHARREQAREAVEGLQ